MTLTAGVLHRGFRSECALCCFVAKVGSRFALTRPERRLRESRLREKG